MIQPRTALFLLRFVRPQPSRVCERELLVGPEQSDEATIYLPARTAVRAPGWVLLHGITVPGRHHEAVRRMARALAAAGQIALVPEVPQWTGLQVVPGEAEAAVRKGLQELSRRKDVDPERIGLIGFSLAGTWGLQVAARETRVRIRTVVSVGGYASIRRTIIAMVVGEHDFQGRQYAYEPDPYGRWIMGANLLPLLNAETYGSLTEREQAAAALLRLARTAGRNGAFSKEPVYDTLISTLRECVPAPALDAWDLLAPPSANPVPDHAKGRALADALADAADSAWPGIDPAGTLSELRSRVILLHGKADRLVPFTEAYRLRDLLPPDTPATLTVTRLFGHTRAREARLRNPAAYAREVSRFARLVDLMLDGDRQL